MEKIRLVEIIYSPEAKEGLLFWKKSGNKAVIKKIELLIEDIIKNPFSGIGKPEALKHEFSGLWSRRINLDHRMIYEIVEVDILYIHSLVGHYDRHIYPKRNT